MSAPAKTKIQVSPLVDDEDLITVLIETPKGSRNKYAFDEKLNGLILKKTLPRGMTFPFDFGCVPSTRADDGDPLDVLVLVEEPVPPLCFVKAHLIGIIEAEQIEGKKSERNDRLVAVAALKNQPAEETSLKKLPAQTLKEIERFFVSYNELSGKQFRVLDYRGPRVALKRLKKGLAAFKNR